MKSDESDTRDTTLQFGVLSGPVPHKIDLRLPAARWRAQRRPPKPTRRQRFHPRPVSVTVTSHLGEIFQGWVMSPNGRFVIGLVTMPDATYTTTATLWPSHSRGILCSPAKKAKAIKALTLILQKWDPDLGVTLQIESTIPEGIGAGSSTADCWAVALGGHQMLGIPEALAPDLEVLQQIIFAAEGPCDPLPLLGWGLPVVWGSRTGELLEVFHQPLPAIQALGFATDPNKTVSTDELAMSQAGTQPTSIEADQYEAVLSSLRQAITMHSVQGVAEAATWSGTLNQSRCRIRNWDLLQKIARNTGAVGVSCSHSGTAAALLWDPSVDGLEEMIMAAKAEVEALNVAHVHTFRTDSAANFWRAAEQEQGQWAY
jgi:L-threonine kinase